MSYQLKKPITEKERTDFIVKYNHNMGLRIEDTEKYLFALEDNEMMGEKEEGGVLIPYPVINPDYEEEQAEKEHERIQALSMTRSDFFDNTIKAWGVNSEELLPVVEGILDTLPISDIEKKIAINNYENALNFYRKHTLFTLLSGIPITIGENTITMTAEHWDSFFVEVNKRNPDAYKELLPDLES